MSFELFVNGTLMRGLALHGNLEGATFLGEARTAPAYRVYPVDDRHPGMFEAGAGGVSVQGSSTWWMTRRRHDASPEIATADTWTPTRPGPM